MNTRENWRKLLSLFLVLTMCLATLPLSAFAEEDCAHEWGEWETSKEPTCSEEGEQTRTCSLCGDTETEALEKLEHTPEDVDEVPPAVGVPGSTAGVVCAVCGEVLEGCEEIATLEEPEAEDEPVRVVFACTPEETEITVFEAVRNDEDALVPVLDENNEPVVIEPEEDGSWLLLPGEYLYDAECDGYEGGEMAALTVIHDKEGICQENVLLLHRQEWLLPPEPAVDESGANYFMRQIKAKNRSNVYNASAAAEYAITWWNSFNPDWYNWESEGYGDCANFVSQCVYAGGMEMTTGWYWNSRTNYNYSGSWTIPQDQADYFSSQGYLIVVNPASGQVSVGDILLYDWDNNGVWDHSAICVEASGDSRTVCAHSNAYYSQGWTMGAPRYAVIQLSGSVYYAPVSCLDVAEGGDGTIHVRGWSFDRDDLSGAVPIHIYVGSNGDTNHGYAIEANSERVDVNNVYNVGDYHGFDAVITVNERGTQTLYFWACDIGGGPGNQQFATATVTINNPASSNSGNSIQLDVPLLPQANGYTCADASARECIAYYMQHGYTTGKSTTVPSEAQLVTEYGSGSITPIVNGLSDYCGVSFGYKEKTSYETFYSDVYNSISKGNPVVAEVYLADSSSWVLGYTTDGHYIVISGIQKDGNETYLTIQDPWNSNGAGIGQTITVNAVHICNICVYYLVEQNGLTVAIPETGSLMSSGAGQTISDGEYIIAAAADTNYYLDIDGFDCPAAECTNVHLWGPTTPAEVQACDVWTVEYIDDGGFYTICQKQSNAALDVDRASLVEGGNVDVYPKNGSVAQEWSIYPLDGNTYRIQAKCSGYALDIVDANISSGTNVRQWSVNDSNAQKWVFIPFGYTVTYDANGGTGAPSTQIKTYDTTLILSSTKPTRDGYNFLGWATSAEATTAEYQPGASYTAEGDATLYAVWELKNANPTIVASGICGKNGDNLTWTLDSNGLLTISGTGAMADYQVGNANSVPWYDYTNEIKRAVLSEGVTSIGKRTLRACGNLTSVEISSSVASIYTSAFQGCEKLTDIIVNAANQSYGAVDGVLFNADMTSLLYCPQGKSGAYVIPAGVESVSSAFQNCTNLSSVLVPEGVISIDIAAFNGCSGLNSVTIPVSVESIGADAFSGCIALEDVYYGGTQAQWETFIAGEGFGAGNDPLTSATVHFVGPVGRISGLGGYLADATDLKFYVKDVVEGIEPHFVVKLADRTENPVLTQVTDNTAYALSGESVYTVTWDSANSRWVIRIKIFPKWISSKFTLQMTDADGTPLNLKGYLYKGVGENTIDVEHSYSFLDYLHVMSIYKGGTEPKYTQLYEQMQAYGELMKNW